MFRITTALLLTLPLLALTACATPSAQPLDWNRPFTAATTPPVLLHDMAIANPPYPRPYYANYLDEPTRFIFRPRPPLPQTQDNNPDEPDNNVATDGSYLENGILYVDPNQ